MADWLKLYDVYVYNKMTIRFHAFTSLVQHMYIWYYNLVWNWIFNWETICRRHHTINSVFIGIANESNAFTAPNIQLITALDQFTTYIHTCIRTLHMHALLELSFGGWVYINAICVETLCRLFHHTFHESYAFQR